MSDLAKLFREFLATRGLDYDKDAGGKWRYWRMLKVGERLSLKDWKRKIGEPAARWVKLDHRLNEPGYEYRRPIERPTEELLEAMLEDIGLESLVFRHPISRSWTQNRNTATGWLDAIDKQAAEASGEPPTLPAAPGEGEGRRLTLGEAMAEALLIEDEDEPEDNSLEGKLANADSVESIALLMERVEELEQQVADLNDGGPTDHLAYLATLTHEAITAEGLVERGFEHEFDLVDGQRLKHRKTLLWVDLRKNEKPVWPPYIGCLRPQNMADVDWILVRLARN